MSCLPEGSVSGLPLLGVFSRLPPLPPGNLWVSPRTLLVYPTPSLALASKDGSLIQDDPLIDPVIVCRVGHVQTQQLCLHHHRSGGHGHFA